MPVLHILLLFFIENNRLKTLNCKLGFAILKKMFIFVPFNSKNTYKWNHFSVHINI